MMNNKDILSSFWLRLDRSVGPQACWPWIGAKDSGGYGICRAGEAHYGTRGAHRIAYMMYNSVILDSKDIVLHGCDNPPCCNPRHLGIGTQADNMKDMRDKGRSARQQATACANGHAYDGTYREVKGQRHCRVCQRERMRRHKGRRKI